MIWALLEATCSVTNEAVEGTKVRNDCEVSDWVWPICAGWQGVVGTKMDRATALNRRAFQSALVALRSQAIQRAVAQKSPAIESAVVTQESPAIQRAAACICTYLYSNFLFPFWNAVKFPCYIILSDKE